MMFKSALVATVLLLTGLSAQAAPRTCFWKDTARGFAVTRGNHVRVQAAGGVYELAVGPCFSLRFADRIAFRSYGPQVCPNDELFVVDWQGRIEDRCWIRDIRRVR